MPTEEEDISVRAVTKLILSDCSGFELNICPLSRQPDGTCIVRRSLPGMEHKGTQYSVVKLPIRGFGGGRSIDERRTKMGVALAALLPFALLKSSSTRQPG